MAKVWTLATKPRFHPALDAPGDHALETLSKAPLCWSSIQATTPRCAQTALQLPRQSRCVSRPRGLVIAINPCRASHRRLPKRSCRFPSSPTPTRLCASATCAQPAPVWRSALVLVGRDGRIKWRHTDFPIFHQSAADVRPRCRVWRSEERQTRHSTFGLRTRLPLQLRDRSMLGGRGAAGHSQCLGETGSFVGQRRAGVEPLARSFGRHERR